MRRRADARILVLFVLATTEPGTAGDSVTQLIEEPEIVPLKGAPPVPFTLAPVPGRAAGRLLLIGLG